MARRLGGHAKEGAVGSHSKKSRLWQRPYYLCNNDPDLNRALSWKQKTHFRMKTIHSLHKSSVEPLEEQQLTCPMQKQRQGSGAGIL